MVETIPFDPDDLRKEPLHNYGQAKLASEIYLKEPYLQNSFPATIIMPGQISVPDDYQPVGKHLHASIPEYCRR